MKTCCCGRPAAQYPSLIMFLFYPKEARQRAAAHNAGKCVTCYTIDLYIAKLGVKP